MNQNPNEPNYNPNPYGPNPNPVNPNYPAAPGTNYSESQPPSASNPGYPSYPPLPPNSPSGPNPQAPDSGYGPYGSPIAPTQKAYPDPITPLPPVISPNPYDPYAPTVISQQKLSSPGYPSYPAYPPVGPSPVPGQTPMPQPPPTSQKRNRLGLITVLLTGVILVIGGSIFGVLAYNNNQNSAHANATATVQTSLDNRLTATAQNYATSTAIASTYPFSNSLTLDDPMIDNSKSVNWDNDQTRGCFFSGSAYHVVESQSGFYNTCAALNTSFTNFTFETEMVIKSSSGSSGGGLLFRADERNNKFYRLSIDTTGSYFVLVVVDTTGTSGNARTLKQGSASSFSTGLGQTNTLAIVARGNQFSFYVNQQLVTTFTDSTYSDGEIGFDADYGSGSTEVLFTNTKVWELPF